MWIVFLHIAVIFMGFALTTGVGIYFSALAQSGNPAAIRAASGPAVRLATAGGVLVLLAAALGFAAATVLQYPLTSRWLVITYVLVALLVLDGFGERLPWLKAVRAAALASPDDRPSSELTALIESPRAKIGGPLSGLLWLAIVYTMVFKP